MTEDFFEEFTQGVCEDGAAILRDGEMLTIDTVIDLLNSLSRLREAIRIKGGNEHSPSQFAYEAATRALNRKSELLREAETILLPLVEIADSYDSNDLDDEARKWWGVDGGPVNVNITPHREIELYSGRGGKSLLTLEDAMKAREFLRKIKR